MAELQASLELTKIGYGGVLFLRSVARVVNGPFGFLYFSSLELVRVRRRAGIGGTVLGPASALLAALLAFSLSEPMPTEGAGGKLIIVRSSSTFIVKEDDFPI